MKRIMIAAALSLVAALQIMGQQAARDNIIKGPAPAAAIAPVAKCAGPDGKPCTAAHVKDIANGISSGRRQWKPLEAVKAVSLASPDRTLKCEQNNGTACTAEQLDALNNVAGQLKCAINYNSSKSNTSNRSNIKNN